MVICKGLVPTLLIRDIGIQRTWSMAHPNLSTLGSLKWGYLHSSISFAIRHNQRTCISNRIVVFHKKMSTAFGGTKHTTQSRPDHFTPLEIILLIAITRSILILKITTVLQNTSKYILVHTCTNITVVVLNSVAINTCFIPGIYYRRVRGTE